MPTRTIFFHITAREQIVFYALALISAAICFDGFRRRWELWRQGRPFPPVKDWTARGQALFAQVLEQRRVRRRRYAGEMHLLIFYGMIVLFLGTSIVAVEHYGALAFGDHWLYRGWFYLLCKVTLDLFGLGLLVGALLALA